jgi:hypothetical protein
MVLRTIVVSGVISGVLACESEALESGGGGRGGSGGKAGAAGAERAGAGASGAAGSAGSSAGNGGSSAGSGGQSDAGAAGETGTNAGGAGAGGDSGTTLRLTGTASANLGTGEGGASGASTGDAGTGSAGEGVGAGAGGAGSELPEIDRIECSFYGDFFDIVDEGGGVFSGVVIGEVFRNLYAGTRRYEFAALIGGPATLTLVSNDRVELRAVGDQIGAKPFWRELEVLAGEVTGPDTYEGAWTCASLELDEPGFPDVGYTAPGTWRLEPER